MAQLNPRTGRFEVVAVQDAEPVSPKPARKRLRKAGAFASAALDLTMSDEEAAAVNSITAPQVAKLHAAERPQAVSMRQRIADDQARIKQVALFAAVQKMEQAHASDDATENAAEHAAGCSCDHSAESEQDVADPRHDPSSVNEAPLYDDLPPLEYGTYQEEWQGYDSDSTDIAHSVSSTKSSSSSAASASSSSAGELRALMCRGCSRFACRC